MADQSSNGSGAVATTTASGAAVALDKCDISLADVKAHLRLSSGTLAVTDDYLLMLLNAARDWVENYCGFRFGEEVTSEYVTAASRGGTLRVKRLPIVSVSSVADAWDDDLTEEEADDYRINNDRTGIDAVEDHTWELHKDKYLVTYTGGYGGSIPTPHGVKVAILTMVARWYETRDTARYVSHEGQVSKSFFDFHASDIIRILDMYKLGGLTYAA